MPRTISALMPVRVEDSVDVAPLITAKYFIEKNRTSYDVSKGPIWIVRCWRSSCWMSRGSSAVTVATFPAARDMLGSLAT